MKNDMRVVWLMHTQEQFLTAADAQNNVLIVRTLLTKGMLRARFARGAHQNNTIMTALHRGHAPEHNTEHNDHAKCVVLMCSYF